ncbi:MAG: GerMN domain-containing protein [Bacillota bacterium]
MLANIYLITLTAPKKMGFFLFRRRERLLTLTVQDGVAYVNFSKEFQSKHSGGTAGESMTLYSVVNSLARLQEIKQVQFLLEGQKQESILGHADTSVPIAPNWNLVAK